MGHQRTASSSWWTAFVALLCLAVGLALGRSSQGVGKDATPTRVSSYENTETMYDANGKAYEVPARDVFHRYTAGKLGLSETAYYDVWDPDTSVYIKVTGKDLVKLYESCNSIFTCRYDVKGHPNSSPPQNLAPPNALLP